jgi:hypothetical protein
VGPAPPPLLVSHGWPGSVWEFNELIPRLTDPARFGVPAAPARRAAGRRGPEPRGAQYLGELREWLREETGYQWILGARPQTLAHGLRDTPAGLAG